MKLLCLLLMIVLFSFLTSCNQNDLAQLAASLSSSTTATDTPGSTSTGDASWGSSGGCFYTMTITYDLGPGIDVSEDFYSTNVDVLQKVVDRSAVNCPREVSIPVMGAWRRGYADEVAREGERVVIHPSWRSSITLDVVSTDLFSDFGSVTVTKKVKQVSNGMETQVFDSGSMTSADSTSSNAKLVLRVSYYYKTVNTSGSGSASDGWMSSN